MRKKLIAVIVTGLLVAVAMPSIVCAQAESEPAGETPEQTPPPAPAAPVVPAGPSSTPVPAKTETTPPVASTEKPTLDIIEFQGAAVNAVVEYYARLTNRTIISAPNLAGAITFRSQTRLTLDEAIQALDSVLAINGIAVMPMGEKFLKVVQIATAKQEGPPIVTPEGRGLPVGDALVTQIIALKYVEAADMAAALTPFLHGYGGQLALPKSNSLLLTDTGANILKLMEIIKYVDQPSPLRMETKVYVLAHAKAVDVVQRLQGFIQETQQLGARATAPGQPAPVPRVPARPGGAAPTATAGGSSEDSVVEGKVVITSDDRTNKIFVMSRPSNFEFFDKMIRELDAKVEPDVQMKVIALDYANAEEVAAQLNSLITGAAQPTPVTRRPTTPSQPGAPATPPVSVPRPVTTVSGGAGTEVGGFLQFAEGVRILPDPRTNSLLIMATKEDMARIEELVRSIDTAVAQVLVEVVIAEVKLDNALDVGVEAVKRMFKAGQVLQTGSTGSGAPGQPPVDLSSLSGELLSGLGSNAAPLALSAATGGLTYFATFRNLRLDMVLRLMSSTSKFKVLSTPIIQTLHNQEASIIVGESRPVVTSTVSDVVAANSTAVRSSVEFKDIAIELKVTPRINPDGFVTMDIEQKINDLGGNVKVNGVDVPIITKREAKSAVAVKNESTIVLGGLIREDKSITESKVPFFGDIPLIGLLFKSKSSSKGRTELIVFIRPTVMRGDAEAVAEAQRRSRKLKAGEELQLEDHFNKPAPAAPVSESGEPPVRDNHAAKVEALKSAESGVTP